MGPAHHYDLVNGSDDPQDELDNNIINNEKLKLAASTTPWWKYVIYIVIAASAGFGAAFGAVFASSHLDSRTTSSSSSPVTEATNSSSTVAAADSSTNQNVTLSDLVLPHASAEFLANQTNESHPLAGVVLDCGWSYQEAREKGCVYDVMMQDWVPEPCYDGVLTERYLARGNYTWYADVEGNVMSDEEMRKGEHSEAWMSGDYHKDHCIFSWEKLVRAMRLNRPMSQELVSYDHVLHCHHQTLNEGEGSHSHKRDGAIGVRAPTNYAKCALYSTWQADFIPDKHDPNTKK